MDLNKTIVSVFECMPNNPKLEFSTIMPNFYDEFDCNEDCEIDHPVHNNRYMLSVFYKESEKNIRINYDLYTDGQLKTTDWTMWQLNHALQDWAQAHFH
jgi:hypothetical protein